MLNSMMTQGLIELLSYDDDVCGRDSGMDSKSDWNPTPSSFNLSKVSKTVAAAVIQLCLFHHFRAIIEVRRPYWMTKNTMCTQCSQKCQKEINSFVKYYMTRNAIMCGYAKKLLKTSVY